jgi:hypothetical protein
MDTGIVDLSELLQRLEHATALRYRLALLRDNTDWKAHTLIVEDERAEDNLKPAKFTYDYEFACFSGGSVDYKTVCQWLSQREGELQSPSSIDSMRKFKLPPFAGQVNWQRYHSHASVDYRSSPWPITRYEVTGVGSFMASTGFLVSDVYPFFQDFRTALLKLMYQVDTIEPHVNNSPSPLVIVKLANTEAWLRQITITPTVIQVNVDGNQVGGSKIIFSDSGQLYVEHKLSQAETVECPLPDGVPTQLYIMLARGNTWLDYYHRDERWTIYKKDQDNVEIESNLPNRELEIEGLIAQGEGPQTEFKRELSDDRKRFLNTVSAFANTAGGTIILGVDDSGNPYGLEGDVKKLGDTIVRIIHDNVTLMPEVHILDTQMKERSVIAVVVAQTTTHACGVNAADPRYYVRRGASNFPARPEDITNLVLARRPAISSPLGIYGMKQPYAIE